MRVWRPRSSRPDGVGTGTGVAGLRFGVSGGPSGIGVPAVERADVSGGSGAFLTAGAGGGTTRRTVRSVGYDSRLTPAVAPFADRPGAKKHTTVPAQLPNEPSPTGYAEEPARRTRGSAEDS
ncbi:hypothetical protein SUDANB176_05042 [Streptomyces sp. enrichment culture]